MTKPFSLLIILICQTICSFACLNTYQFKIFPVGVSRDRIVAVDFQIRRTSVVEGNRRLKLGLDEIGESNEMWILCNYLSTYDKNQKLLSLIPLDTTFSIGKHYADSLDAMYQRGIKKIAAEFTDIDYFRPEYISLCNYQHKCSLVAIHSDTASSQDYVVYEGVNYQADILQDLSYYGFDRRSYHPESITELYINSVRIYKTNTITLLLIHLATGHELSMGLITSDPKKAVKTDSGEILLAKEHRADFAFTEIQKSTFEEPLLHHGYGLDILIVK